MTEHEILAIVNNAKRKFGTKCGKYAGAVCAESIRAALRQHGVAASSRDVFIDGVPIEIDLVVPRPRAVAEHGLLYQPEDVLVAIEIKNSGSFGNATIETTSRTFATIRRKDSRISCVYVTLAERKGFRFAVTNENVGASAFTLFEHNGASKNREYKATGDWGRLIAHLSVLARRSNAGV
jgi:hypothetical protein